MAFDTTNLIPRLIDLDFKQVKFCSVSVEQYDKDSTYLDVSLYDDGNVYTIPVGTTVSFGGTKPSSHIVLETATIENNKIYYKISEQCTVKEGDYPVKFTLYLPNGAVKYTQEFKIQVRKAVISSDAIADVDEVNVLNELIVDASQAIVDADTATTNATTATGLANTATVNANNATTSANNAATLANTKAGLADTATTNANNATQNAITATANANNARYMGEYVGLTAYKVSNIVKYGNALYICKVNSTGNLPTNTTYWDISSKQFNWRGIYDNTTPYTALDAIYYLGSSYICKQNSTGNIPTNTTYFDPLSLKGDKGATLSPKGSYNPLITYVLDDLVNHNASVWQCLVESTGVEPTEGVNWTIFLTGGGAIGDLGTLYTTDKTSAVAAINELHTDIGDLSLLETTSNTDLVGAINENTLQLADIADKKTLSDDLLPFKLKTYQLKGQMHCHTTTSDGAYTPTQLLTMYKDAGYDFVAITDHDKLNPSVDLIGIIHIRGSEYFAGGYRSHLCVYNISKLRSDINDTIFNVQNSINLIKKSGGLCSFAHPQNNIVPLNENEGLSLNNYNMVEVYTGFDKSYYDSIVDNLLKQGKRFNLLAVDDFHTEAANFFNDGWIVVNADMKEQSVILREIENGNYYSSNGNNISLSLINGALTATSTSSSNITFVTDKGRTTVSAVTSAGYTIQGDEVYIRVESQRVSDGKYAWSNPLFINKKDLRLIETNFVKKNYQDAGSLISVSTRDREKMQLMTSKTGATCTYLDNEFIMSTGTSETPLSVTTLSFSSYNKKYAGRTLKFSFDIYKTSGTGTAVADFYLSAGDITDTNCSVERVTYSNPNIHSPLKTSPVNNDNYIHHEIIATMPSNVNSIITQIKSFDNDSVFKIKNFTVSMLQKQVNESLSNSDELIKHKDVSVSMVGLAPNAVGFTTFSIPSGYVPLSVKCTSHLWYLSSLSLDGYFFYKNIDGVSKTETAIFRVYFIKSSLSTPA